MRTTKAIIGFLFVAALIIGGIFLGKKKDAYVIPMTEMQTTHTVVMETSAGDITLELFGSAAPKTVENFVKLAGEGFYDGTRFHRVIPDFMIQAGDPQSRELELMNAWGTGGPGYQFEDEIHANNTNLPGTIAMANAGPNTNGSQFFINVADNGFLNDKHTVFGQVTDGYDIAEAISQVATEGPDRPVEEVVISKIIIQG